MKTFCAFQQWNFNHKRSSPGDPFCPFPPPFPGVSEPEYDKICIPFDGCHRLHIKRLYGERGHGACRAFGFLTALSALKKCCEPVSSARMIDSMASLREQLTQQGDPIAPAWLSQRIRSILHSVGYLRHANPPRPPGPNNKSCQGNNTNSGGNAQCISTCLEQFPGPTYDPLLDGVEYVPRPDSEIREINYCLNGRCSLVSETKRETFATRRVVLYPTVPDFQPSVVSHEDEEIHPTIVPDYPKMSAGLFPYLRSHADRLAKSTFTLDHLLTLRNEGEGLGFDLHTQDQCLLPLPPSLPLRSLRRSLLQEAGQPLEFFIQDYCNQHEIDRNSLPPIDGEFDPTPLFPVTVHGIYEPLKIRLITIPDGRTSALLHPLQKRLHRLLRKSPVFSAIGASLSNDMLDFPEVPGMNTILSGDYDGATNRLNLSATLAALDCVLEVSPWMSDFDKEVARRSFSHVALLFPSQRDSEKRGVPFLEHPLPGRLRKGQLMGNILSFPLLCLINAACMWEAYIRSHGYIEFRDLPARINGDDTLSLSSPKLREQWDPLTSEVGFKLSFGKNLDGVHGIMNSCAIIFRHEDGRVRGTIQKCTPVGLLAGCSKVQRIGLVEESGSRLPTSHNYCVQYLSNPEVIQAFYTSHYVEIKKALKPGMVPDAHELLGGLGFVPTGFLPPAFLPPPNRQQIIQNCINQIAAGNLTPISAERVKRFMPTSCPTKCLVPQRDFDLNPIDESLSRMVSVGGKVIFPSFPCVPCSSPEEEKIQSFVPSLRKPIRVHMDTRTVYRCSNNWFLDYPDMSDVYDRWRLKEGLFKYTGCHQVEERPNVVVPSQLDVEVGWCRPRGSLE